jgi:hypothetical protein
VRDDLFLKKLGQAIDAFNEEPYVDYWKEFGHFMHVFTIVEQQLVSMVRKYARVNDVMGNILFSGTRIDDAKKYVNLILERTGKLKIKELLASPLNQFSTINTIRNHLIHWGVESDGQPELFVSNKFLTPSANKLKEFRISIADLKAMRQDLYKISAFFVAVGFSGARQRRAWTEALSQPWQYKPPQPAQPRKGSGKTRNTRHSR